MVKRLLAMMAGTAMLAACGSDDTATVTIPDGEAEYTVNRDSGEADIQFRGGDGETVSIRSGANLAAELPDGFSIYRGAEVTNSTTLQSSDGAGINVMMTSSDSPERMVEFYRKQAEDAGFSVEMDMKTSNTHMISGRNGTDGMFSFNASTGSSEETTGHLMIGAGRRN